MWRNRFRNIGVVAAGLVCSIASAQPRNDLCAGAPLIGLGAAEGTTAGAAANGSATCGLSTSSPDVYYRFTAPATCQFEVLTCDGNTDFDTVLSIHSACPANGSNQIVCSNDGCGSPRSRAVFSGTQGVTYTIRIAGFDGDFGKYSLIIRQLGRPTNDTCDAAMPIAGDFGQLTGDTTCAMSEGFQSCGQGTSTGAPNLFYRWTAPSNGRITFDTCAGASFRTYLSASTDCPHTNLNLVGCNQSACDGRSIMEFRVVHGATYTIRVGGRDGERGTFTLGWTFTPSSFPQHDGCTSAQPISLGSVTGTSIGSLPSASISCAPNSRNDVFYVFTSPVEALVTINTCSTNTTFDTVLSVHTSCPVSDANIIACNDHTCGTSSSVSFNATPGLNYYVRVAGAGSTDQGFFVLNAISEVDAIVLDPSTLGEYYLLEDNKSIQSFRSMASGLNAQMVGIGSFSETQFVTKSVMQHGSNVRSAVIGLNDAGSEGTMRWENGDQVNFTFFLDGQPDNFNNGEDYVHILDPVSGVWNDYPGVAVPTLFGVAEASGEVVWGRENPANGRFYAVLDSSSWQGALARARAMGADLVSISDAEENEFVRSSFGWFGRSLWLGLNDAASEGVMRWTDGSSPTYANFMPGQPNNDRGNEDYIEMRHDTGLWADAPNIRAGSPTHAVIEFDLPRVIAHARGPGGCGAYALLSASTFYPSQWGAYWAWGYPAAVGSHEENEFIRATFAQPGGGRRLWLGATDRYDEGNFIWLTEEKEAFAYSNFAPGEPDNSGAAGAEEDYIVMNPDGTWSDVSSIGGQFFAVIELYSSCDWDVNADITSQDLFDFLAAFFAGQGDINCDHITNSQDLFDFLACFLD